MNDNISFSEIFNVIFKRRYLIILFGVLGVLVSGIITSSFITPVYSSSTQIIVKSNFKTGDPTINDVNINLQMIHTYKDIIKGNIVLDQVKQELKKDNDQFDKSTEKLSEMISVESNQNSQAFFIIAESESPYEAANISNKTAEVFQSVIKEVQDVDNVSVLSPAKANNEPISPNLKASVAVGLFVGIIIGVFIAFILQLLDKTVKDAKYIEKELGYINLGVISEVSHKELEYSTINNISRSTNSRGRSSRRE